MKIEVLKKHLEEAVQMVSRVSNKNLSLPVLGCILISATTNGASLRATNLDVSIEVQLKSKINDGGVVAIPAQVFLQAVNAIIDEKIHISTDGNMLNLKTKHGETNLKTVDASEFPSLPYIKKGVGVSVSIPSKEFIRSLKSVVFSAANSGMRPELAAVFISMSDGTLTTAATDSFRLAEMTTSLKTKESFDPILVPARNIPDIIRTIDPTDTVEIRVDDNQATYIAGGNFITSRLIDGAFPEYNAIIPKKHTTSATVLLEDLSQALRKVTVVTDQSGQVDFNIDTKKRTFTLTASSAPVGTTHEYIESTIDGENIAMRFNARYIIDALNIISTDSVTLQFSGPGKPLVIHETPNKGFTYLLMPMNR